MVAKRHLGVKFAMQITRLDSNFQHIALQAYTAMKAPTLDEFTSVVNDLYTKQSQCTLFELPLLIGKPIEEILSGINVERQKSRAELLDEIEALKTIQQRDRQYARNKYAAALREIAKLKNQINLQKAG